MTGHLGNYPSVVIAADGKVVVAYAAQTWVDSGYQFGVARFNPDGGPDNTFGTNGYVSSAPGGYPGSDFDAVALQPNGEIVAAGSVFSSAGQAIAVARYLPSEPQIGSFTANSTSVTAGSSLTLTASGLTDGNPNSTITQVAFYVQVNGTNTLLGYGSQNGGVWTLTVTVNLAPGSYTLFAQAEDSDGVFGDPLDLNLQVL